jgi:hypothetical protein
MHRERMPVSVEKPLLHDGCSLDLSGTTLNPACGLQMAGL